VLGGDSALSTQHSGCFDAGFRSFEKRVLPELQRQGIAPIGMKSLGGEGNRVKKRAVTVTEALRYAMSLPVGTTVSGIDSLKILRQNLRIAAAFEPMIEEDGRSPAAHRRSRRRRTLRAVQDIDAQRRVRGEARSRIPFREGDGDAIVGRGS